MAPSFPTTDFRTSSAAAMGHVNSVPVTVPGVGTSQTATLQLRAFLGDDFSSALARGFSSTIDVVLGGDPADPTALVGLSSFFVVIPEPSTIALGVLGLAALVLRRRK